MLVAINLLRHAHQAFSNIIIIEKESPGTLGHAYSTSDSVHLLNVPAHNMSAFANNSDDFTDWLSAMGYDYGGDSFVPRKVYKQYIYHTLQIELNDKEKSERCILLNDRAIDIIPAGHIVLLESGVKVHFDKVILALGNFAAAPLALDNNEYLHHPGYFPTAWNDQLFSKMKLTDKVLIIGTGLTMVDVVLSLRQQQHAGAITALSVHGLTPMPHHKSTTCEIADTEIRHIGTALQALKMVRRHIREVAKRGISWHSVVDAIRPCTQSIWQHLSVAERKLFMQHLRHLWGVARHRVPNECSETLQHLLKQQQLSIVAGRIRSIMINHENTFNIHYRERHSQKDNLTTADVIVNCMGPESNYEKLNDPLIKNLLQRGLIRTDQLQLGVDCTPEGVIIEKDGGLSSFLYTIGPPAKGILWEITSVPEIRAAAARLARLVISNQNQFVY